MQGWRIYGVHYTQTAPPALYGPFVHPGTRLGRPAPVAPATEHSECFAADIGMHPLARVLAGGRAEPAYAPHEQCSCGLRYFAQLSTCTRSWTTQKREAAPYPGYVVAGVTASGLIVPRSQDDPPGALRAQYITITGPLIVSGVYLPQQVSAALAVRYKVAITSAAAIRA